MIAPLQVSTKSINITFAGHGGQGQGPQLIQFSSHSLIIGLNGPEGFLCFHGLGDRFPALFLAGQTNC